jgi:outer membrane protein assembly factor BamE (lipoprotein component of BamABCDE complex)
MKKFNNFCYFICCALVLACSSGSSNIKKAKSVRPGMTVSEVKAVLGEPKMVRPGYEDTSQTMFLYGTGLAASTDIEIYFDKNSNKVTRVLLPKGEDD